MFTFYLHAQKLLYESISIYNLFIWLVMFHMFAQTCNDEEKFSQKLTVRLFFIRLG
jgi:hypothetical protein